MSFGNFTIETDGDGIAVVTWNEPERTMNVINAPVMAELSALVGTSPPTKPSRAWSLPRARRRSAPAPT